MGADRSDPVVQEYYRQGHEHGRLRSGAGLLEFVRTQDVLRRHLPPPPASVLDVGGGTGVHAEWLVADGYRVDLVDPVPLHVRCAAELPGVRAALGDARGLDAADGAYDAVLLCGPLYHLTDAADRARAWAETRRVVRPGGLVAAATVSRFASTHGGIRQGFLLDAGFREMVSRDLVDGQHRPPPGSPWCWFTDTYFHHPTESADEARAAGLDSPVVLAVEGTAWLLPDEALDGWLNDAERRRHLLWALRQVEREPSLVGASSHLLTLASG
jgi:SAM-dependent methyltransferase